jgi:hypothetical protein
MFETAVYVPITLGSGYLLMNGHRLNLVNGLSIPERIDLFPGTRPDDSGLPIPHTFKGKLQEHLPDPPKANTGRLATASPSPAP